MIFSLFPVSGWFVYLITGYGGVYFCEYMSLGLKEIDSWEYNSWVKHIRIFNHKRCCHIAFQKDCINMYFQPERYYIVPISPLATGIFGLSKISRGIFPSDQCKLISCCGFTSYLSDYTSLSFFSYICWAPGIAFLWVACSYPLLSFLLWCLSLTSLFCKSSLCIIIIIAVHTLNFDLLPGLMFIYWLSLWCLFQTKASDFYLIKCVHMCFIASEFPILIKKLSPPLHVTCGVLVLLFYFLQTKQWIKEKKRQKQTKKQSPTYRELMVTGGEMGGEGAK